MYVCFAGYVTRFLFKLCSCEAVYMDDSPGNHAMQHQESQSKGLYVANNSESYPCQLHVTVHKQSVDSDKDCCQSGTNKNSVERVYDDDGDLIVKRKCCQQFEILYIG